MLVRIGARQRHSGHLLHFLDIINPRLCSRRCRYYTGTPEFEFGDGLSYTSFDLQFDSEPATSLSLDTDSGTHFNVSVTNSGERHGAVTVLAFWRPVGHHAPLRQKLFAFDGLTLGAGDVGLLSFHLPTEKLAIADASGDRYVNAGGYEVFFKAGSGQQLAAELAVEGAPRLVERSML